MVIATRFQARLPILTMTIATRFQVLATRFRVLATCFQAQPPKWANLHLQPALVPILSGLQLAAACGYADGASRS